MAVIINELEVVLEPPPPQSQPGGGTPVPQPATVSPHDIRTIVERQERLRLRVLAH
jgi:hypothetical protein